MRWLLPFHLTCLFHLIFHYLSRINIGIHSLKLIFNRIHLRLTFDLAVQIINISLLICNPGCHYFVLSSIIVVFHGVLLWLLVATNNDMWLFLLRHDIFMAAILLFVTGVKGLDVLILYLLHPLIQKIIPITIILISNSCPVTCLLGIICRIIKTLTWPFPFQKLHFS